MKQEIEYFQKQFQSIVKVPYQKISLFSKIMFLILLLFYFWQYFFLPESITNFFLQTLKLSKYTYFVMLDFITFLFCVIAFKQELKISWKNYNKQLGKYLCYLLFSLFIFSIINLGVSFICNFIVGEAPLNQQVLQTYNKIYLVFSSLVYAPFVEEILFREVLKKFFHKRWFLIISAVFFGIIHVVGVSNSIQYIYILEYGFSGLYFAFLYEKFNNIYLNITAHFILNLIGVGHIIF